MKTNLSQKNDTVVKAPRAGKDSFLAVYLKKYHQFAINNNFSWNDCIFNFIPGRQSTEATKNNFFSVANSLKPNMANGIENHGHYGQIFAQIWPKYGHIFSQLRPYLQFLLHFYVTIFAKISNWQICKFYKMLYEKLLITIKSMVFLPDRENLKILRGKDLKKFVICNKHLWMCNCKVKFGQDGPKIDQKWPEISKIFA